LASVNLLSGREKAGVVQFQVGLWCLCCPAGAMIEYNQGKWSVGFAFSLNGSVFPMAAVWAFPCSLVSMTLHRVFRASPEVVAQLGAGDVGASVLAGFTFILGFLVVFRSQQAYARWWEGGTLLQQLRGEWFNAYSNLLAFCNTCPDRASEVTEFQHRLVRLVSLLNCAAIQQVSTMEDKNYELIDIEEFNHESLMFLKEAHDRCEVCLQWIQRLIGEATEKEIIKVSPPVLSRVYNQLGNGIVNLNNARKITEFPIPFPLAQMITFMLLFHWGITAFVCAASVETTVSAGMISFIVVFSFWSINYIAVELEQPFGDGKNDLPLHEMQIDLNLSLKGLLDDRAQRPPLFNFKTDHLELNTSRKGVNEISQCRQSKRLSRAASLQIAVPEDIEQDSQLERDHVPTQTEKGEEGLGQLPPKDVCSNMERSSELTQPWHPSTPAESTTWRHASDEHILDRVSELEEGDSMPPMLHVTASDGLKVCGSGEPGQEPTPPKTEHEPSRAVNDFSCMWAEGPLTCGDGRKRPPCLSSVRHTL